MEIESSIGMYRAFRYCFFTDLGVRLGRTVEKGKRAVENCGKLRRRRNVEGDFEEKKKQRETDGTVSLLYHLRRLLVYSRRHIRPPVSQGSAEGKRKKWYTAGCRVVYHFSVRRQGI